MTTWYFYPYYSYIPFPSKNNSSYYATLYFLDRCMWTDCLWEGGAAQKKCVISGIGTHAYKSRLWPRCTALDRSAILTSLAVMKSITPECWVRTGAIGIFCSPELTNDYDHNEYIYVICQSNYYQGSITQYAYHLWSWVILLCLDR